ncbi:hypothetical protein JCM8202v2_000222 [Rhodotorula sphaerocarpa]
MASFAPRAWLALRSELPLGSACRCSTRRAAVTRTVAVFGSTRLFTTSSPRKSHDNPLGLPRSNAPPTMPRMQRGLPQKRRLPGVKKVVVVSSGKGGVGKSSVAVNLALALANTRTEQAGPKPRVGLLDLDIFGPSIPKLMGLEGAGEPLLTEDTPVVWRGMMVMKAVQQLLFDVDWRAANGGEDLDVLVIDTPPGTGDITLSLGQLVEVDGSVVVSTPQSVALIDTRKGVATFRKLGIPITGAVLNMSYFHVPGTPPSEKHYLFGPPTSFEATCTALGLDVLAQIPIEPDVSTQGDRGTPVVLRGTGEAASASEAFRQLAAKVWSRL